MDGGCAACFKFRVFGYSRLVFRITRDGLLVGYKHIPLHGWYIYIII